MERRLAAIVAADMVGYSRRMGDDEAGTLVELKAHRKELIYPKAAQYHGRTRQLVLIIIVIGAAKNATSRAVGIVQCYHAFCENS